MKLILIYITNPTRKEAINIAKHLLKKRLIACANISTQAESFYPWRGKLVQQKEYVLIAKTKSENFSKIKNEIETMHSYAVPCIIKIRASSNKKYFDWLIKETK